MSVNDDIRELVWLHKLWDGCVFVFDYLKEIVRGMGAVTWQKTLIRQKQSSVDYLIAYSFVN